MNRELAAALSLVGRVLLIIIFLLESWVKITSYAGTAAYMERFGVPAILLPLVLALEIAAPVLIVVGWQARLAALGLAGFCLLTAIFFHADFSNANQELHFWKNVAMAGGFLVLAANGAGLWSLDARREKASG